MLVNFRLQLLLFTLLMSSMLFQYHVVRPVEDVLMGSELLGLASLMFIPHGVKVVCMVLNGSRALIPIFVAQLLFELMQSRTLMDSVLGALVSVVSIFLPLVLFNYLNERPLMRTPVSRALDGLNLFRVIMVFACATALINALISASWHASAGIHVLALRYLFGDVFGALVALIGLILSKKVLIRLGRIYTNQ